jgi:hypothetical protein
MLVTLVLAASMYLQVSPQVASLQCDLDTTGTVQLNPALTSKQITSQRLSNGLLRIFVWGFNQSTFSGTFAAVDAPVVSISNQVTASSSGVSAGATISLNTTAPTPGPSITIQFPTDRTSKMTRRLGDANKVFPFTVNKSDCVWVNGVLLSGGLNCQ